MTARGTSPLGTSKKRREWGISSRGRCALVFDRGRGWSHGRGRPLPAFLLWRILWSGVCRWREGVRTEGGSRAAAGLISGGEQSTLKPPKRFLYEKSRSSGGRQASIARMSVGMQVVTCVHVPVTVHRSGQCSISYVHLIYIWFI